MLCHTVLETQLKVKKDKRDKRRNLNSKEQFMSFNLQVFEGQHAKQKFINQQKSKTGANHLNL